MIKKYKFKEIKALLLTVTGKYHVDNIMSGRGGLSREKLKLLKQKRPDIPMEVFLFVPEYTYKGNSADETNANDT